MKALQLLIISILITSFTSCDTDTLCSPQAPNADITFTVTYDWSRDSLSTPAGMRLWFYPADGSQVRLRDIPGRNGGSLSLPPGVYDVLTYNNDSEWINFAGTDRRETHTAFTPSASLTSPPTRTAESPSTDEAVRAAPDELWSARATQIELSPQNRTITLTPTPHHCYYDFVFRHVGGLDGIQSATAAITGMASGIDLSVGNSSSTPCTHPLSAKINKADSTISGSFITFGPVPDSTVQNRMMLFLTMKDGAKYKLTQDSALNVTTQVRHATDPRHVSIVVSGINLSVSTPGSSAGVNPGADDWADVNVNVPI